MASLENPQFPVYFHAKLLIKGGKSKNEKIPPIRCSTLKKNVNSALTGYHLPIPKAPNSYKNGRLHKSSLIAQNRVHSLVKVMKENVM